MGHQEDRVQHQQRRDQLGVGVRRDRFAADRGHPAQDPRRQREPAGERQQARRERVRGGCVGEVEHRSDRADQQVLVLDPDARRGRARSGRPRSGPRPRSPGRACRRPGAMRPGPPGPAPPRSAWAGDSFECRVPARVAPPLRAAGDSSVVASPRHDRASRRRAAIARPPENRSRSRNVSRFWTASGLRAARTSLISITSYRKRLRLPAAGIVLAITDGESGCGFPRRPAHVEVLILRRVLVSLLLVSGLAIVATPSPAASTPFRVIVHHEVKGAKISRSVPVVDLPEAGSEVGRRQCHRSGRPVGALGRAPLLLGRRAAAGDRRGPDLLAAPDVLGRDAAAGQDLGRRRGRVRGLDAGCDRLRDRDHRRCRRRSRRSSSRTDESSSLPGPGGRVVPAAGIRVFGAGRVAPRTRGARHARPASGTHREGRPAHARGRRDPAGPGARPAGRARQRSHDGRRRSRRLSRRRARARSGSRADRGAAPCARRSREAVQEDEGRDANGEQDGLARGARTRAGGGGRGSGEATGQRKRTNGNGQQKRARTLWTEPSGA